MRIVLLCWNRFPDYVKSDMMGTSPGDKETARRSTAKAQKEQYANVKENELRVIDGVFQYNTPYIFSHLWDVVQYSRTLAKKTLIKK